ncbi:hypothetical protein C0J52_10221 [Blattella germanica]|nr:hypothetical protein C0J52_10221 [Blattella germanica]
MLIIKLINILFEMNIRVSYNKYFNHDWVCIFILVYKIVEQCVLAGCGSKHQNLARLILLLMATDFLVSKSSNGNTVLLIHERLSSIVLLV